MYPGVDIIEIARFTEACNRHPRLINRLFTPRELEGLGKSNNRFPTLAARFAGKEAVLKALGTGLRGLSWHDIEIIADEQGEPLVYLSAKAWNIAKNRGGQSVKLSLSHSRENAIAVAILY
ncbi:MAG TPA: holo-ACP synthase [Peptococcaceae bacterium]|nr:holo-ACP synthase [Peptococcaceae bacterium]